MTTSGYTLRRAEERDFGAIRGLVRRTRINPFGLDWRRFLVVVDTDDEVVGCGQLKPHGRAILEMASIAVHEAHRGRGLARRVIDRLITEAPRPLYLTCRSGLRSMYTKWGFQELQLAEMPAYYQRMVRLMAVAMAAFRDGEHLSVMVLK